MQRGIGHALCSPMQLPTQARCRLRVQKWPRSALPRATGRWSPWSASTPTTERAANLVRVPATFADDDLGYERWLRIHRAGYVLNCDRNPKASYLMLHRSHYLIISGAPASGSTWTRGGYIKVCADTMAEIEAWARTATGGGVQCCGTCVP